jgi:hypothetical protein
MATTLYPSTTQAALIRSALPQAARASLTRVATQIAIPNRALLAPWALGLLSTGLAVASVLVAGAGSGVVAAGAVVGTLATVLAIRFMARFSEQLVVAQASAMQALQEARCSAALQAPVSEARARAGDAWPGELRAAVLADRMLMAVLSSIGQSRTTRSSQVAQALQLAAGVALALALPSIMPAVGALAALMATVSWVRCKTQQASVAHAVRNAAAGILAESAGRWLIAQHAAQGAQPTNWTALRQYLATSGDLAAPAPILSRQLGLAIDDAERLLGNLRQVAFLPNAEVSKQSAGSILDRADRTAAQQMVRAFLEYPDLAQLNRLLLALGVIDNIVTGGIAPEASLLDRLPYRFDWTRGGYEALLAQMGVPVLALGAGGGGAPGAALADRLRLRGAPAPEPRPRGSEGQLAGLERQRAAAEETARALRAQIAELQRQLADRGRGRGESEGEAQAILQLRQELAAAQRREQELWAAVDRQAVDRQRAAAALQTREQDLLRAGDGLRMRAMAAEDRARHLDRQLDERIQELRRAQDQLRAAEANQQAAERNAAEHRNAHQAMAAHLLVNGQELVRLRQEVAQQGRALEEARAQMREMENQVAVAEFVGDERGRRVARALLMGRIQQLLDHQDQAPIRQDLARAEVFMNALEPDWRAIPREEWPAQLRALVEADEARRAAEAAEAVRAAEEAARAAELELAAQQAAAQAARLQVEEWLQRRPDELLELSPIALGGLDPGPDLPPPTEAEVERAVRYLHGLMTELGLDRAQDFNRTLNWLQDRMGTVLMRRMVDQFPGVSRALRDSHLLIIEKERQAQEAGGDLRRQGAQEAPAVQQRRGEVQAAVLQMIQATQQCWGAWEAQLPMMVTILRGEALSTQDWIIRSLLEARRQMASEATIRWSNEQPAQAFGWREREEDIRHQVVHVQNELRWLLKHRPDPISLPGARDAQHDRYFDHRLHWTQVDWESLSHFVALGILQRQTVPAIQQMVMEQINQPDQEIRRLEIQNEIRAATLQRIQPPAEWMAQVSQDAQQALDDWIPDEPSPQAELDQLNAQIGQRRQVLDAARNQRQQLQQLEDAQPLAARAQQIQQLAGQIAAGRMQLANLERQATRLNGQRRAVSEALGEQATDDQVSITWQQMLALDALLKERDWGAVFDHTEEAVAMLQDQAQIGPWLDRVMRDRLETQVNLWIGGLFPDDRCSLEGALEILRHLGLVLPTERPQLAPAQLPPPPLPVLPPPPPPAPPLPLPPILPAAPGGWGPAPVVPGGIIFGLHGGHLPPGAALPIGMVAPAWIPQPLGQPQGAPPPQQGLHWGLHPRPPGG